MVHGPQLVSKRQGREAAGCHQHSCTCVFADFLRFYSPFTLLSLLPYSRQHMHAHRKKGTSSQIQNHIKLLQRFSYMASSCSLCPDSFCSVLLCPFQRSILIVSLVFCTARLICEVIQKCHSASCLVPKHYHTNNGSRTKASVFMLSLNLN